VIWDGSPFTAAKRSGSSWAVRTIEFAWKPAGLCPRPESMDEGGWHHLKHVEMRNLVCRDLEELHEQFHLAVGRLRHKPHLVQSFFAQAGLALNELDRIYAAISK